MFITNAIKVSSGKNSTSDGPKIYFPLNIITRYRYEKTTYSDFDVFLTVHLCIFIFVINQLDAQNFCFTINLFHASTCFEHHVLIIRRSKLYYTASGMITLCGWPSRAPDGHPQNVMIPAAVKYNFDLLMMSIWC